MNYLIFIFSLLIVSNSIFAAKPLYEFGLLGFTGYSSDYPAADEGQVRRLAIPAAIYRGSIFRSDNKGTRARIYKTLETDIDISFGASFPTNADENKTREGMDDLDWLSEIGPRLNFEVFDNDKLNIELEFPMRLVFSTDFSFTKYRGIRFYPEIDMAYRLTSKIKTKLSLKMNWATEELNDFFYEVSAKDVTTIRPRYDAKGGYIGKAISLSGSYKLEHGSIFTGVRYNNYSDSTNKRSPLFKSTEDVSLYLGFIYFFYQSSKLENS